MYLHNILQIIKSSKSSSQYKNIVSDDTGTRMMLNYSLICGAFQNGLLRQNISDRLKYRIESSCLTNVFFLMY